MELVDAEQRRTAIKRMLTDDPARSQESIGAELGISQSQVQRYIADLRKRGVLPAGNSSRRGRPAGTVVKLPAATGSMSSAGEDLAAAIKAELDAKGLEPDSREAAILAQAQQVADEIEQLRQLIAVEGMSFPPATKGGPPRAHWAVAEARQLRAVLARLLSQISLQEGAKNATKQKAANTRWRPHRAALAARYDTEESQRG